MTTTALMTATEFEAFLAEHDGLLDIQQKRIRMYFFASKSSQTLVIFVSIFVTKQ